ncbi:DUF3987 domain-containing protein [Roseivirga pacifica]|uniref:DUF3987 domain-containing protein n=1 Tax=Roseivirga pacifica TaxID=1267423 RepID=UPI00209443F3|nr:DUF3987 domain-containing protein [Roseivirga pacifica]MCO6359028.1 DUF3987 domain-containing protein [Roseivirga pacifica]MCO6365336.1 DUF3987 domain-containing protein [Roseivirga pacifica]MCO6371934.1 DUF3987 domain-containing protein [Roseivirga pacifica]MCO6375955.1 DUF3987 domain-containing protein [Roseivirga pacifica]MCO6379312.1 DUF3987 domain-containing protein [Roseivirga pacifica]
MSKYSPLSTASPQDLEKELEKRKLSLTFPLHVFPDKLKPLLDALHKEYSIPRSFIGTALLISYSTAIGTSYHVENSLGKQYLSLWACLEGISSSGKSVVSNYLLKPLKEKHAELLRASRIEQGIEQESAVSQILVNETNMATLLNEILRQNPKGILFEADEILGWVNGMNKGTRGTGNDEEFWLSIWNSSDITKRLSKGKVFFSECPFISVFGGIQPNKMIELFKNNRDSSGFAYRILFAIPEEHKVLNLNLKYSLPLEWSKVHSDCIEHFLKMTINSPKTDSESIQVSDKAIDIFQNWKQHKIDAINHLKNIDDRITLSSIFGKFSEYTFRFAGILHLLKCYFDNSLLGEYSMIDENTMQNAIYLSEYYHQTARDITERVNLQAHAPQEILTLAALVRQGKSLQQIGNLLYSDNGRSKEASKKMAQRRIKKGIAMYPKVFGT